MQTWHCIALILISIGVYFYASYIKEVDQHSQRSINLVMEETSSPPPLAKEPEIDSNLSSTWAEIPLLLKTSSEKDGAIHFHEEIFESKLFLERVLEELGKSPMASSIIFSPFTSELLSANQFDIISSLISLRPRTENSLRIICKGHSTQAAKILADTVQGIYHRTLASETSDSPVPPRLAYKLKKIQEIELQMDQLKISVQEEMEDAPSESIEVMALRSEVMQLDEDIKDKKAHLIRIEEIYSTQQNPNEFLHIAPIRDFGNIEHVSTILEQLKSMLLDPSLNNLTRKEVQKNIQANSVNLEKQVVLAIESLKKEVTVLLYQKRELQKSIFEQISDREIALQKSHNVISLQKLKESHANLRKEYEDENLLWMSCKSSYSLIIEP
jgi:hypothetical protein